MTNTYNVNTRLPHAKSSHTGIAFTLSTQQAAEQGQTSDKLLHGPIDVQLGKEA